jgi:hypothetical protein
MSRKYLVLFLSSLCTFFLVVQAAAKDLIPAGTILHCTMDETNFSPKTAMVGDPVLCHLGPLGSFGHSIFPRGALLGGHLQDYKAPGHFFGKGWMAIEFDRMILPGAEVLPLSAKITSAPHLKTDAQGDIHGKGHPKRDAVLWLVPPLWPIKILTLPARGPYPALKGENRLSLRLMEDVEVPFSTARNAVPAPPWANPSSSYRSNSPASYEPASMKLQQRPAVERVTYSRSDSAAAEPVTLIATQQGSALLARQYWLEGTHVHCVTQDGSERDVPLSMLDLAQTVKLNQERNVEFNLHGKGPSTQALQQ